MSNGSRDTSNPELPLINTAGANIMIQIKCALFRRACPVSNFCSCAQQAVILCKQCFKQFLFSTDDRVEEFLGIIDLAERLVAPL